jgi:hypothetical protein
VSRVMPRPADRCPQCQLSFSSVDLMLDHLNADHGRQESSNDRSHAAASIVQKGKRTSIPDAEIADLERMFRQPSRPRARRVAVIAAIGALLLIACAVAILG